MFCVVLCRVLWSADEKEPIYILDITSTDCQFTVQEWPSQSWSMYTKNSIKLVFSISYALFVFTSFVHVSLWECCHFDRSLCVFQYLSNADERARWTANTLPADDLCTENAIMLKRFNRYPLVIDPSGQATEFLMNEYKEKSIKKTRSESLEPLVGCTCNLYC